jgi:hypothetical protein
MYKFYTQASVKVVLKNYLIKSYSSKLCIKVVRISYDISKIKNYENLNFQKMKTVGEASLSRIKCRCEGLLEIEWVRVH